MAVGDLPIVTEDAPGEPGVSLPSRRREIIMFATLAVLIWPFIAVGVVAGWGFLVWMYQLIAGPPGPA